jgi:hypothetical protein
MNIIPDLRHKKKFAELVPVQVMPHLYLLQTRLGTS